MNLISRAKSAVSSKRGLGVIGLVLFFMLAGCTFFTIDHGVYHYRCVWFVNSMFILWLSLSVGYKIILILNLKKIDLLSMGWLAFIAFVIFFVANLITTTAEVPMKIPVYHGLVFSISLIGSIAIDAFVPLADIDARVQSAKKFANFCASKILRIKTIFN